MIYRLKQIAIFTMIIGFIGLSLNLLFGYDTVTYISTYYDANGIKFYRYDFAQYIRNIETHMQSITVLDITKPTRTWQTGEWGALTNDLALILDWILFAINVLIYPLRVGGYILQNLWCILGISETIGEGNRIYWLYKVTSFLMSIQIPYV